MRNVQFSSRDTDIKVAFGFAALLSVAFVGFLPVLFGCDEFLIIIAPVLSLGFAGFAWGVFNIVEPPFYGRKWAVAKAIGIPVLWLALFLSFTILLNHAVDQVVVQLDICKIRQCSVF